MIRIKSFFSVLFLIASLVMVGQNQAPDITLVFYVDEGSEDGTLIGSIDAVDPDGDPITYTIQSGNTGDAFEVDATSGDISVNTESAVDFEVTPTFELMVLASDGNGGDVMVSVTINVNDIDEAIVLGISEANDQVSVYPNPVIDQLTVDFTRMNSQNVDLRLFTLGGAEVKLTDLRKDQSSVVIDFSSLKKGIYLLILSNENDFIAQRRIVAR